MKPLPIVSIIIPTFNYANFIIEALDSLKQQSYPMEKIQVIVVDDGSTDDTKNIIKAYKADINISYHYQKNKGKAAATQEGIRQADGEYLFNLDADDWFHKDKLATVVSIFEQFPEVTHVGHPAYLYRHEAANDFSSCETIPKKYLNRTINGQTLLNSFYRERILFGGGSTFAARKSIFDTAAIDSSIDMYIDEFLLVFAANKGFSYFLEQPLSYWRIHGKNYSINQEPASQKLRDDRLLNSSLSMLNYVRKSDFEKNFKNLYSLTHLTRVVAYQEKNDTKNLQTYWQIISVIFSFNYPIKVLFQYRIFNRLAPTSAIKAVKKLIE